MLLENAGYEVAVFSDQSQDTAISNIRYYKRPKYRAMANYFSKQYRVAIESVISDFNPKFIFFIGGIVNTPRIYYRSALKYDIRTVHLLLVQDFFCSGLHAIIEREELLESYNHGMKYHFHKARKNKGFHQIFYYLNYLMQARKIKNTLLTLYKVLGSSEQQLRFYKNYGFKNSQIEKIPLFFDRNRIDRFHIDTGDYFLILAQNRIDKGVHVIHKILDGVDKQIPLKVMFQNQTEVERYISDYPMVKDVIHNSNFEIIHGKITDDIGGNIFSNCFAVINPSLWATTTEFVLLEALGFKKPMIGFSVGIHKEIIKDGFNGLICEPNDYLGMAQKINNLFFNRQSYLTISQNAKILFDELTSEKKMKVMLKRIFQ